MTEPGAGLMLNWLDLAPGAEPAFVHWHNTEHLPERVAVPGFLRGARYRAVDPEPERGHAILIAYEAQRPEAFASAAYLARLNAPTRATQAMVPQLRRVSRAVYRVTACAGGGLGGWLLVAQVDQADAGLARQLCGLPGVLAVCVGQSLPALAGAKAGTREGDLTPGGGALPAACLLLHVTSETALRQLADARALPQGALWQACRLEALVDCRDCQHEKPQGSPA